FHFSAREPQASRMTYSNPSVYMGAEGADEDTIMLTTEKRVRNTIDALMRMMA
ncbi:MAG: copper homeostasis protein CutC, partial [Prevotella sp.]|nr:copper homeostasis protein CutC [Prevotella sp.]